MERPALLPFEHEPFDDTEPETADPELVERVRSGLRDLGAEIANLRRENGSPSA